LVNLSSGATAVWKAEEALQEITFPAGNWTLLVMLNSTFAEGETMNISLGAWDGYEFTPAQNGGYHFIGYSTKINV
jgi:hypothetical protein